MPLTVYTRDELRDIVLDHIRGRVAAANTSPGSDYWHLATAIATVVHGEQASAEYLVRQILPGTAERTFIELHAYMRQLERLRPAAAIGKVLAIAAGASTLVAIPSGTTLIHASGLRYVTTASEITSTPSWGGARDVAPGSNRQRLTVTPSATGISVDDPFRVDSADYAVAKAIVPDTGTPIGVDLYVPLPAVPSPGTDLDPIEGAVLAVSCSSTGANTNLLPGETLAFETPIAGLEDDVIVLELTGGGDVESDDELRARLLAWMAERPGSGNRADYRQWARETPGIRIADAFVYPSYRGLGTVDVIPFGVAGARITGTAVNQRIFAHLEERGSFHDDKLVVQLTEPTAIAIDIDIDPASGYERDWNGTYTVAGADTDHRIIELGAAPNAIEIGDRVLIQTDTVFPRLWQRTVVGKLTSPNRVILDEPLPEAPTASSTMRPGGPLAQPAIDAIASMTDDLGPGDTMDAARYPTPGQAYPHGLLRARITDVVMDLDGAANVSITSPASDEYPTSQTRLTLGAFTIRL